MQGLLHRVRTWFGSSQAAAQTGKVKFFNRRNGYGFIETPELDSDVFMHVTQLEEPVKPGDQVAFELKQNAKGLEAVRVRLQG
ncbi:MAG: cold shock domain-containing protein [Lewinellaceae bacterium]|nr:cold shock domain-containing protein [Lewinellaceae bacterium]